MTIFASLVVGHVSICPCTNSVIPVAQNPARLIPFTYIWGPSPQCSFLWTSSKTSSIIGDVTFTQAIECQTGFNTKLNLKSLPL